MPTINILSPKSIVRLCHAIILSYLFIATNKAIIVQAANQQNSASATPISKRFIELNRPQEGGIKVESNESYYLSLRNGEFAQIKVTQLGIDLEVTLFDPEQEKRVTINNNIGTKGQEELVFIADKTGDYQISIRAYDKANSDGNYRIELLAARPFTEKDVKVMSAQTYQIEGDIAFANLAKYDDAYQDALEKYQQAAKLFEELGYSTEKGIVLRSLASLYYSGNKYKDAITTYKEAISLLEQSDNDHALASALIGLANVYYNTEEFGQALNYYDRALPIWVTLQDNYGEAYTLGSLGNIYFSIGENLKAIEYHEQAAQLHKIANNQVGEASEKFSLAGVYFTQGDYNEAITYFKQCLETFRATKDQKGEINTLKNLGIALASLNDAQAALDYYSQALTLLADNRSEQANIMLGIGGVYLLLKDYEKALIQDNQALEIYKSLDDIAGQAITLTNVGFIYFNAGDKNKAIEYYKKAYAIFQAATYRNGMAAMLYGLAISYRDLGNINEAQAKISEALKIVDAPGLELNEQTIRTFNFVSLRDFYQLNIDILMQLHKAKPRMGYDAQALAVWEKAKARLFTQTLSNTRTNIIKGISKELAEQERKTQKSLLAKLRYQQKLFSEKVSKKEYQDVCQDIEKIGKQLTTIKQQIINNSPQYAKLIYGDILNIATLQKEILKDDTTLLEYFLGTDHSYLWLINSEGIQSYELAKRDDIEAALIELNSIVTRDSSNTNANIANTVATDEDTQYHTAAIKLSNLLLAPIGALKTTKLIVVADSMLRCLPFNLLTNNVLPTDDNAPKFIPLIDEYSITNIYSINSLIVQYQTLLKRKIAKFTSLAIIADPVLNVDDLRLKNKPTNSILANKVPASIALFQRAAKDVGLITPTKEILPRLSLLEPEIKSISSLISKENYKELTGFAADRNLVINNSLQKYQILHWDNNALIDNRHPEFTGVVFSLINDKGSLQEGFLRARELYNLDLNADLVVLMGGTTRLTLGVKTEALSFLTKGLLYAGSRQVLTTLWPVNDEVRVAFTKRFYEELAMQKTMDTSAALKAAQLSIKADSRWTAPYYWATFVLEGDLR